MNIIKNKYFILGNILLLLLIIPLTLFIIKRQTDLRSKAEASTSLTFSPTTVNKAVGEQFSLDIYADPGQNIVSIVQMTITVDPNKLEIVSLTKAPDVLPVTLSGPTVDKVAGKASLSVSTSNDVSQALSTKTKIATLTLKAKSAGSNIKVQFDKPQSEVFSIANSDGVTENVLSTTGESTITIAQSSTGGNGGNGGNGNNGGTGGNSTNGGSGGNGNNGGTGGNSTNGGSGGNGNNGGTGGNSTNGGSGVNGTSVLSRTPTPVQKPVCTGLFLDRSAVGTAPYSLVFTASGSRPQGTISKVTFSFGDGVVQDVTQAGGVGTANVNVSISHTYNNAGSFPATVTMTDSNGQISEVTSCKQTINVSAPANQGGTQTSANSTQTSTGTNNQNQPQTGSANSTIPATGTIETTIAIVAGAGLLILLGLAFLL